MKRQYGKQTYYLTTTHKTKKLATKRANELRKIGHKARVIKLSDVWGVYFTAGKHNRKVQIV